jgi:hypothetical protein
VFKFRGHLGLCTFRFLIPLYCISCHIRDNVSFKFRGVDKHYVCLFVFGLYIFVFLYIYIYIYIFFYLFIIFFFFTFLLLCC